MAPNTPNEYASVTNPFGSIDIHSLTSPPLAKQEPLLYGAVPAPSHAVLSANSDHQVFVSYDDVHATVCNNLLPTVVEYQPSALVAVNGGGYMTSLILKNQLKATWGSAVPILPVTVSTQHDFVSNEDRMRVDQWFDESSSDGLRVNGGRVLIVSDLSDLTEFVKAQILARYLPHRVAVAVLHATAGQEDMFYGNLVPSDASVCYPWDEPAPVTTIAPDVKEVSKPSPQPEPEKEEVEKEPSDNYWDWPAEDITSTAFIEKQLVHSAHATHTDERDHQVDAYDNYWDWDATPESVENDAKELLERILEDEKVRLLFTAKSIEETLVRNAQPKQEEQEEVQADNNAVLGNVCGYWDWNQDDLTDAVETKHELIDRVVQEEKIRVMLSADHLSAKLQEGAAVQSSPTEVNTQDADADYWTWQSTSERNESSDAKVDILSLSHMEKLLVNQTEPPQDRPQETLAANHGYWEWPEETNNDDVQQLLHYVLMREKIRSALSADTIGKLLALQQKQKEECEEVERADVAASDGGYWDM